jgi:hypothetical protein
MSVLYLCTECRKRWLGEMKPGPMPECPNCGGVRVEPIPHPAPVADTSRRRRFAFESMRLTGAALAAFGFGSIAGPPAHAPFQGSVYLLPIVGMAMFILSVAADNS